MVEQNTANTENAPAFRLEKLYLKDLSFESPNSPDVFFLQNQEPKVDMNLKMTNRKIDDKHWEVCLEISATITDGKSDKTLMIVEVEHAGGFLMENIPENLIEQVLHVDCPTILFPYTRQIISQASVDGGFMPFLMEPINFPALYQAKKQKTQEKKDS
ncbi:protein-export chaperone SecB [Thermodesulfobacteriota bacterium]